MDLITKYFSRLSEEQQWQIDALDKLYRDWNAKINVISRKDEVININEKDNTFSTMKMSEKRVVRSRLFTIQGKK